MNAKTSRCGRLSHWVLCLLCVVCLATRVGHIFFERHQYRSAGTQRRPFESELIACDLVDGKGYSFYYALPAKRFPTANAPPGIVFLLAGLYASGVSEPSLWFQLIQAATSVIALVLTWLLARSAFSESAAWIAAVLFVFDVNLSYTAIWVQETAWNVVLTLGGLWGLVQLAERPTRRAAALSGLVFGLGVLVRPTVASILAVGLGWLWWARGRRAESGRIGGTQQFSLGFAHLLWLAGTVALVLAPWTLRNAVVFGRFIPVSQNLGLSLWYGNNPKSTGSQVDAGGNDLVPEGALRAAIERAQSEADIDRAYRSAAMDFIGKHPLRSLVLRIRCFAYYWLDHNYWLSPPRHPVPWWIKAGNIALVSLFAVAAIWHVRQGGVARLLLLAVAASCLTYTLIHADLGNRYRMQIEPLMVIFIGALVAAIGRWLRGWWRAG